MVVENGPSSKGFTRSINDLRIPIVLLVLHMCLL